MVIFAQPFSVFTSVFIILGVVILVFLFKLLWIHKRIDNIYGISSVAVFGPATIGKTNLIKELSGAEPFPHPSESSLQLSFIRGGDKKMLLVNPAESNLDTLRNFNLKYLLSYFDVSGYDKKVEQQIEDTEKLIDKFRNVKIVTVADITKKRDKKVLEKIKGRLSNVHEVSLSTKSGLEELKTNLISSE